MKVKITFFLLFSFFSIFCSTSLLAIEDEDNEEISRVVPSRKPNKELCSHWGLSHWLNGIQEYFQRCLCCCSYEDDKEGAYVDYATINGQEHVMSTSDCYCSAGDPLAGTLCCPVATTVHLLCLPFALCNCSKNQYRKSSSFASQYPPIQTEKPKGHYEFVRSTGNIDVGRNISETGSPDYERVWISDK